MRILILAALVSLAACNKEAPPVAEPQPETTTPENTGGDPTQAAGAFTCATDDDCVISCAQKDNCCDQLCPPCRQAFHKDELAQIEQWREGSCAAQECPVAKCMAPTETTVAKCQAGACVVETTPMQP